jgi:hypothetical protein
MLQKLALGFIPAPFLYLIFLAKFQSNDLFALTWEE